MGIVEKSIVLQFSRDEDFGSRLIRWFDHGDFSHVDIVQDSGRLYGARSDVCVGVPAGVQSRPSTYAKFTATKRVTIPVTDTQCEVFWKFVLSQEGKPYDSIGIFGFIIGRNWREDDAWFCSELVCRGLEVAYFFPYPLADRSAKIAPDDLLLLLSEVVNVSG